MLTMLLAYDAAGNVIATIDSMVARDADGNVTGLIDFAAHEEAGGELLEVWNAESVGDGLAGLPLAYQCPGGPDVGHFDANDPLGLADCPGGEWRQPAKGSKTWPEWLGGRAYDFRVETAGPPGRKRIVALVHKTSGHRRERAAIEAAIEAAPVVDGAKDLRALLGGPDRALTLDDEGRTVTRVKVERPDLPVIRTQPR